MALAAAVSGGETVPMPGPALGWAGGEVYWALFGVACREHPEAAERAVTVTAVTVAATTNIRQGVAM